MDSGRKNDLIEIFAVDLENRDRFRAVRKDGYTRVCRILCNVRILNATESVSQTKENTRTMISCLATNDRRVKKDHILRWEGDDYRVIGKPRRTDNRMDMVITAEALV